MIPGGRAATPPAVLALLPVLAAVPAFYPRTSAMGLLVFAVPGALVVATLAHTVARSTNAAFALTVALPASLAWAWAAKWLAAESMGSVARTTAGVCGAAAVAAVLALSRAPALALLAPVGVLMYGYLLVSTSQTAVLAGVVVVLTSALYLVALRRDARRLDRPASIIVVTLAVALMSGGILSVMSRDPIQAEPVPPASTSATRPTPSPSPTNPTSVSPTPSTTASASPEPDFAPDENPSEGVNLWRVIALVLGTLTLFALLIILAIRVAVAWRWWRLQKALKRGSPSERVVGAWSWYLAQRHRQGDALPTSVSPDRLGGLASGDEHSDHQRLGAATSLAMFGAAPIEDATLAESWTLSTRLSREEWKGMRRGKRLVAKFRPPRRELNSLSRGGPRPKS